MISRTLAADLPGMAGQQATIAGWLHRKRQLKSMTFLIVRDRTGLAQAVLTEPFQRVTLLLSEMVQRPLMSDCKLFSTQLLEVSFADFPLIAHDAPLLRQSCIVDSVLLLSSVSS